MRLKTKRIIVLTVFFLILLSTNLIAQRISLSFFVDRTHPFDLRYWTEKSTDPYYHVGEYIYPSPHFSYLKLKQNLDENKISLIQISSDSFNLAELRYMSNDTMCSINIFYNYIDYLLLNTGSKNTTLIFHNQSIFETTKIVFHDDGYELTLTTNYYFDNNGNIIKSLSKIDKSNELSINKIYLYNYDELGKLTEIKSYEDDSLKYFLVQQNYGDSIVQTINGIKSKKYYISKPPNYKENNEFFFKDSVVVDKIEFYDVVDEGLNTILLSGFFFLIPQISFHNGNEVGFIERLINYENFYFRLPKHWKQDKDLIHFPSKWTCEKTYFSRSSSDFIVYLNERLIANVRTGLIEKAEYGIIEWDSPYELKKYEFNYKYTYY